VLGRRGRGAGGVAPGGGGGGRLALCAEVAAPAWTRRALLAPDPRAQRAAHAGVTAAGSGGWPPDVDFFCFLAIFSGLPPLPMAL